ncbi:MAG TPA: DUF2807 domain-containing protein [Puia sp.]|nr:DUF2807 domain-containing protein [Puia sp.]
MRSLMAVLVAGSISAMPNPTHAQTRAVGHFYKVIVSPYIQATFVEGSEESVTVNSTIVDSDKLHVEVHGGELRLYLDGAKDLPHYQRDYREDDGQQSHPLYPNHAVIVTVVYKKLDALSLRGTETYLCESPLSEKKFTLRVYGEGNVIFTEVHLSKMHTILYGESCLDIRSGEANEQYYTCYGEGKVNSTAIAGQAAKVTAFGEAEFKVNVSDVIRVTSFGEARVCYLGNPTIIKALHFGGVDLRRLN